MGWFQESLKHTVGRLSKNKAKTKSNLFIPQRIICMLNYSGVRVGEVYYLKIVQTDVGSQCIIAYDSTPHVKSEEITSWWISASALKGWNKITKEVVKRTVMVSLLFSWENIYDLSHVGQSMSEYRGLLLWLNILAVPVS